MTGRGSGLPDEEDRGRPPHPSLGHPERSRRIRTSRGTQRRRPPPSRSIRQLHDLGIDRLVDAQDAERVPRLPAPLQRRAGVEEEQAVHALAERPVAVAEDAQIDLTRVTVKGLTVAKVDIENNLLMIRGAVPGANGSLVVVKKS